MKDDETVFVGMMTDRDRAQFTAKPIADNYKTASVFIALAFDSKKAVDDMAEKAVKAGGKEPRPKQDYGFMVQRTCEDHDGHTWEPLFMDPAHVQKG